MLKRIFAVVLIALSLGTVVASTAAYACDSDNGCNGGRKPAPTPPKD